MTRLGWMIIGGIVLVLVLVGAGIVWVHPRHAATPNGTQAIATSTVNPSTLSIYTSGQYGFSFFYPSDAVVTDAYSTTTLGDIPWRIGATASGTPVVRVQDDGQEIRVGVSTDERELKVCTQVGPGENLVGNFTVGSTTWQKTAFQKIGTDNEQRVTSYRIMHDHACYAVELFQPLSGAASSTGYTVGDTITSFTFAD